MTGMRTLRVTGRGQLSLRPDLTRITISLEGVEPDYAEALRRSSADTDALIGALIPCGFARADLKTLQLDVDAEFESNREKGAYKQRLVGYRYRHLLKLEFDSDHKRLGQVLSALASSTTAPEFRSGYRVKDTESAKNALLSRAVADAGAKAKVLAEAASVRLGAIQSIDYSWGEIDLEVTPMNRPMSAKMMLADGMEESISMDAEPDDIEMADTVTVIWALE